MHKLVVLYSPPPDTDKFRSYYTSTHLKLVAKMPGLRAYRYGFDLAPPAGDSPYWCMFEAEFDDINALSAAQSSPEGQAVAADVPNYASEAPVMFSFDVIHGD
ncbi:MAG: EthD family reductase [Solirubrobacteraceae bacterium]